MDNILQHSLREQAGSKTYNRYEYQVGWSVLKAIQKYEKKISFVHFAEYHDDMSELVDSNKMNFYQVKTKDSANFTFKIITYKPAKKKHSFLGYLFYNHFHFKDDCNATYFVSNRPFDDKINAWQAVVKDGKSLLKLNPILYNEIFNILKNEYDYSKLSSKNQKLFNSIFDKFIQKTFFEQVDIPLENSFAFIKTKFFDVIKFEKIELYSAHLIFDSIFDVVRQRTKQTIISPISFTDLKEKKGLDETIFSAIQTLREKENIVSIKESIRDLCSENRKYFSITKEKQLLRAVTKYYNNVLSISNIAYKEEITRYINIFKSLIDSNLDTLDCIENLLILKDKTINSLLPQVENPLINSVTLEALFYVEFLEIE